MSTTPTPSNSAMFSDKLAMTSSIGAMVIECLTILASLYLLRPLSKQGLTKLRVRLLFGMVISDLSLGVIGAVPNIAFLAGHPMKLGTGACNAAGFILTSVLFTQHLWTMVLAIATFALLKHPMSSFTHRIDRYWIFIPISIWTVSILHSGLWWRYIGFAPSNAGSLCYYGTGGYKNDRALVQFIPRASVFVVVIVLYSQLFRFLRRPDTITVNSTQGSASDSGQFNEGILRTVKTKVKLATGVSAGDSAWPMKDLKDDIPPWEKLHINNVGGLLGQPLEPFGWDSPRDDDMGHSTSNSMDRARKNTDTTLVDRSMRSSVDSTRTNADARDRSIGESEGDYNMVETDGNLDYIPEDQVVHSRRGSAQPSILLGSTQTPQSGLLMTGLPINGLNSSTTASSYNLPYNGASRRVSIDHEAIMQDERKNVLVPLPSASTGKSAESSEDDDASFDNDDKDPNRQTLHEFFAQNQPPWDELEQQRARKDDEEDLDPRQSAASYFNRQASLLMLYFPLAYLIVFTFSLVRLLYDMITLKPNPVMTMVSLWFVLSVGLVDAAIYGWAEWRVRRRVRRRMPERFAPPDD